MVEHQDWKRASAVWDVHHAGDGEPVTPVGDDVALVRPVVGQQPTKPEVATVVLLVDQRLNRDRMRGLGRFRRLERRRGAGGPVSRRMTGSGLIRHLSWAMKRPAPAL